jgi:hypothetical protein
MLTYFVQGAKVAQGFPVKMSDSGHYYIGPNADPIFLNAAAESTVRRQGKCVTAYSLFALKRGGKVVLGVPNGHKHHDGVLVLWHLTLAKGQHVRQIFTKFVDVLRIAEYETEHGAGAYVLIAIFPNGEVTFSRSPERWARISNSKAGLQSSMFEVPAKQAA